MTEIVESECNSEGASSRLPVQLSRLPADHLLKVHERLSVLKGVGLSQIKDIDELLESVSHRSGIEKEVLPSEDLTTEYMGMNLWAWTRKRWHSGVSNVKVETQSPTTSTCDQEASVHFEVSNSSPVAEAFERHLKKLNNRHTGMEEHFRAWFATMKQNEEEIKSFATLEALPKIVGDGSGCLFEKRENQLEGLDFTKIAKKQKSKSHRFYCGKTGSLKYSSRKSRGYIAVHLGEEGCDVGMALWRRLFLEHGLGGDGRPDGVDEPRGTASLHFQECTKGRYMPRCIFADYGGAALQTARNAGIFSPVDVLSKTDESVSPWEWFWNSPLNEEIRESIRRQSELLGSTMGFLITSSVSDMTSVALLKHSTEGLCLDYGRATKWGHIATPPLGAGAKGDDHVVRPQLLFNAAASFTSLLESMDAVNFYDDVALKKMASNSVNGLGVASPSKDDCNALVCRSIAALTSPLRIGLGGNPGRSTDLQSLSTNLCPYPRIHFYLPSLGGLSSGGANDVQKDVGQGYVPVTQSMACGSLSSVSVDEWSSIAMSLICRNVEHSMAMSSVMERKMQRDFKRVDWSPISTTVACHSDGFVQSFEVAGFHNNGAASSIFAEWQENCGNVLSEKPEWYTKISSEYRGDLHDTALQMQEELTSSVKDYEELIAPLDCGDSEEEE
eukprot:TRINITY_DN20984_c0_g1_i1.p1 TRINITY_DN20984_c0_g1~~TRINITY_DN20984_c0_g1_i1.p1  ORF type:complete len:696 (-),score=68.85 TRINITY_DN20984_c0_g1_i1:138-2150(-)